MTKFFEIVYFSRFSPLVRRGLKSPDLKIIFNFWRQIWKLKDYFPKFWEISGDGSKLKNLSRSSSLISPSFRKKSYEVSNANPWPLSKPGYNTNFLGVFQDAKFVFRRYNRHGEVFGSRVGPWGFVHAHSQGRGKSLRTTRFSTHLLRRILITFFILFLKSDLYEISYTTLPIPDIIIWSLF